MKDMARTCACASGWIVWKEQWTCGGRSVRQKEVLEIVVRTVSQESGRSDEIMVAVERRCCSGSMDQGGSICHTFPEAAVACARDLEEDHSNPVVVVGSLDASFGVEAAD